MPLPAEALTAMLVTHEVKTGVYATHTRQTCVVVKVSKEGIVHFLHFQDCVVKLETSFREKFLRDYPVQYYQYPALRALRKFRDYIVRDHFGCTPEARRVLNAILVK